MRIKKRFFDVGWQWNPTLISFIGCHPTVSVYKLNIEFTLDNDMRESKGTFTLLNSLVNLLLLKAFIPASCDQIKWNNKTDFNFINWNVKTSSLKIVIAEQLLSVANFTSSNFSYFILWLSMIKCSNLPKSYITLQNLYFEVCIPLIFWLLFIILGTGEM